MQTGDIYESIQTGDLWCVVGPCTSFGSWDKCVVLVQGAQYKVVPAEYLEADDKFKLRQKSAFKIPTLIDLLEKELRNISEMFFSASWQYGLEFEVWQALQENDEEWKEFIPRLDLLSKICDGWFYYKENKLQFVTMSEWLEIYSQKEK